jgi:hypothetical protein
MVKHERSESPSAPSVSPSSSPPPKKSRTKGSTSKAKSPTKSPGKPKGWDTAQTLTLLEAVFDTAAKTLDKDALAAQVGLYHGGADHSWA